MSLKMPFFFKKKETIKEECIADLIKLVRNCIFIKGT